MAHSYIYAKNSKTERIIAVKDGLLLVFICFFNESLNNKAELDKDQAEIFNHYDYELETMNLSFIDLKLQEIYDNDQLFKWYRSTLLKFKLLLDSFGEAIDHNILNELPKLKRKFALPLNVNRLKNLINDIFWILDKEDAIPSEDYKWFEDPLS